MTYLSTENLSKNYGIKTLFEGLTFGISRGDKTALVAPNGTGKSTLLRILAGQETPDEGRVMVQNNVRLGFLEQEPQLDPSLTINEFIARGNAETVRIVHQFEKAVRDQAENFTPETQRAYEKAAAAMDTANAWDYEQRMKQILGKLNLHDLDQPIASLSGGERKRVALAFILLDEPDLLILDEPTNHLDVDMIEWLEAYLKQSGTTLLMVTHDRYFLDRVCNHILELDQGKLYHHKGNYAFFLEKRAERQEIEQTEIAKAGQLMKKELEWLRRQPKARGTKAKSRIDRFYETREKATGKREEADLRLEVDMKRMGGQVLELQDVSKRFGNVVILDRFEYAFNQGERIGIIGRNGVGKSTFINILTGEEPPDSGQVHRGKTIEFGHYRQQGLQLDESKRVIEVLKEIGEVIELANGNQISASRFLEHFMFPPKMQYMPVSKLSGGEKRRLGLLLVLMKNPNFLILDEPTNDLDLLTMNKLEEFLKDFGGCLILISHDRYFMDKLVDHYFIFEGDGVVRDHHGTYREYRQQLKEQEASEKEAKRAENGGAQSGKGSQSKPGKNRKKEGSSKKGNSDGGAGAAAGEETVALSREERKEYQQLENDIARLEEEKAQLERELGEDELERHELKEKSARYGKVSEEIEQKTRRWIDLADRA